MMRLVMAAAVCVFALGVSPVRAEEGVGITPGLVEGRTLVYELGFVLERGLTMGAGRDRLMQEALLNLHISEVDAAGVATVQGSFGWVVIDLDRASFRVRVDSRDIVGDSPNLAETTIREMVAAYLESTFTMRVAPSGDVLELSGLDPVHELIASKQGTLATLAAGRFLPGQMKRDLDPIWRADGAVGRTLSAGDHWESVRESELGLGVMMRMSTEYKVESADAQSVAFSGDVLAVIVEPELEEPLPITFRIQEQSGHAAGAWNVKAGALDHREAETSYTMVVAAPDGEQGSQRTGKSSLKLVSFGDSQ